VPVGFGRMDALVGGVTSCSRWLAWLAAPGERRMLCSKEGMIRGG